MPEELTTPLYSLGGKLLVVCACPRQPRLQSGNNFFAVDTFLYFLQRRRRQTLVSSSRETCCCSTSKPSTWGNQQGRVTFVTLRIKKFLAPLPGTPVYKIGELHTIFYLCFL